MRGRRLYAPRPASVRCSGDGTPRLVGGIAVEGVREEWLAEDRWWTPAPLCRRYLELVLSPQHRPPVRIVAAELGERAGAIGARLLADELLSARGSG